MEKKSLLSIADLTADEILEILHTAIELKSDLKKGAMKPLLAGKVLGMIFQKPSLRTRVSFEVGMLQLGGHAVYLSPNEVMLGHRESTADVARTICRYVDGIMARVFAHSDIETLSRFSSVPVINGLSDLTHPCQGLGDMLTIYEKTGSLKDVTLAYVGDGNNVANSLLLAAAKTGMNIAIASPCGYECNARIVEKAKKAAETSGSQILFTDDPYSAVGRAHVVYTDVWASMGQESEAKKRHCTFRQYQVNQDLLETADSKVMVMHCLPAHRGEEITDDVIDGPNSIVFDQAENRLHAQMAVMALLLGR